MGTAEFSGIPLGLGSNNTSGPALYKRTGPSPPYLGWRQMPDESDPSTHVKGQGIGSGLSPRRIAGGIPTECDGLTGMDAPGDIPA